jgi:hypothetical protein
MTPAAHKIPALFAMTWALAPTRGVEFVWTREGLLSQAQYFENLETAFAEDDVVEAMILPRFTSLIRIFTMNRFAIAGLTANLVVRGNADSLGGTPTVPAPVVLGTIDFSETWEGRLMDYPTDVLDIAVDDDPTLVATGTMARPLFFNQNDMLQLVFTGVPAELDVRKIRFGLSAVVESYMTGEFVDYEIQGSSYTP